MGKSFRTTSTSITFNPSRSEGGSLVAFPLLDLGDVLLGQPELFRQSSVSLGLELLRQLEASRLDDPAAEQDVNARGRDVVEKALVVGDEHDPHLGSCQLV